jgi:hypothetical protein
MGGQKDPRTRPAELADDAPETTDDLATAEAKSRSVDERIPEAYGADSAKGIERPAPATYLPQGGVAVPRGIDDKGPGEEVLEKESEHLRIPKRRG